MLPFDARSCQELLRYLARRAPQRIFLTRFGMVSTADEFLEKLESIAADLAALQDRLAATLPEHDASGDTSKEIRHRTTERLLQATIAGTASAADAESKKAVDAVWAAVKAERARTSEFDSAVAYMQQEIARQLTMPFIAGARARVPAVHAQRRASSSSTSVSSSRGNHEQPTTTVAKPTLEAASGSPASSSQPASKQPTTPAKLPQAKPPTAAAATAAGAESISAFLSPRQLANVANTRIGKTVGESIVRDDIDSELFMAMTEDELRAVFGASNSSVIKRLKLLQQSLRDARKA